MQIQIKAGNPKSEANSEWKAANIVQQTRANSSTTQNQKVHQEKMLGYKSGARLRTELENAWVI